MLVLQPPKMHGNRDRLRGGKLRAGGIIPSPQTPGPSLTPAAVSVVDAAADGSEVICRTDQ